MKKTISEMCPHCEKENTFKWDIETDGYRAHCLYCGEELMLCNACMCEDTKCDWDGSHCYRKIEQAEKHAVNCQFVLEGYITDAVYTVMLFTEEDRTAFNSVVKEGKSIDYQFNVVESDIPIKASDIVPYNGVKGVTQPILNNGDNCMAIRCSDGWLVATAINTDNRWHTIDVTFHPDKPLEDSISDPSAYIEEDAETGELSVLIWDDIYHEDYTRKIILREKK